MPTKTYKLEPDLIVPARVYIYEITDDYTRTAITVYHDMELARRIVDILNNELKANE